MGPLIIAVAGRSRVGKSLVSTALAERLGWPRSAFGDYIRQVVGESGGDPNNIRALISIGNQLLETDRQGFVAAVLESANWMMGKSAVLDGVRHLEVLEVLRQFVAPTHVCTIAVVAPGYIRKQRHLALTDGAISLQEIDAATAGQMEQLERGSDFVVDGTAPVDDNVAAILTYLKARSQRHSGPSK